MSSNALEPESDKLNSPEWLDLPSLTWARVFELLDLLDRLRFRAVCSLFRSISISKQPHRLSSSLLLLPPNENSIAGEFFNVVDNEIYQANLPELLGKRCCGSSFGYLFTVDFNYEIVDLLNPFSKAKISLPPFSDFVHTVEVETSPDRNSIWFIQKATLSTNPSKGNGLIVMTIITGACMLAFCRPGDEDWTILPRIDGPVEDVLYFNGKFYTVTNWGALVSWDLSDIKSPKHTVIIPENDEKSLQKYLVSRRYLAESARRELLVVYRIVNSKELADGIAFEDCKYNCTVGFLVFKLNEVKRKWSRACLCNQALFLGCNHAICLSTVEHPEFKEHSIYFTGDFADKCNEDPYGFNDIGVYDMNDDTVEKLYEDFPFWSDPCIWVAPNRH